CEQVGADVEMIRKGMAADSRIGPAFLFAGVGFGGSCFPKDTRALIQTAKENNYSMRILEAVASVNTEQTLRFGEKVRNYFGKDNKGKHIAVWGLAFKPRTNDMRDAPAVRTISALLEEGVSIVAYDREAMEEGRRIFADKIQYATNNY